jgi:hypothetical protein
MPTRLNLHGRAQIRSYGVMAVCAMVFLWVNNPTFWRDSVAHIYRSVVVDIASESSRVVSLFSMEEKSAQKRTTHYASMERLRTRWDALWSTDISAAERNVATLENAVTLTERANGGDLDAAIDLIGAATWCTAGGSLVNVTDAVGDVRRPCYERFGDALASRETLERATFTWLMQLSAAGLDDAVLYASALLRGQGADLFGGTEQSVTLREQQRAQLLGHLQTLALNGSADAASELHGHWSGDSALAMRDDAIANFYAELTERLDPARTIAARE